LYELSVSERKALKNLKGLYRAANKNSGNPEKSEAILLQLQTELDKMPQLTPFLVAYETGEEPFINETCRTLCEKCRRVRPKGSSRCECGCKKVRNVCLGDEIDPSDKVISESPPVRMGAASMN